MKKIIITIIIAILIIVLGVLGYFTLNNNGEPEIQSNCLDYAPVCSLDNTTYDNSCLAENAGVEIYTEGECEEVIIKTDNLTDNKLKNTTYYSPTYETYFELKNGEYSDTENNISAGIDKIAYGDLNNNNIEDGVTITYISGGGSGTFIELHVVLNDYGTPVCFGNAVLGDRIQVKNLSIENGIIKMDLIVHAEDDPMCCPSLEKHLEYEFKNFELIKKED